MRLLRRCSRCGELCIRSHWHSLVLTAVFLAGVACGLFVARYGPEPEPPVMAPPPTRSGLHKEAVVAMEAGCMTPISEVADSWARRHEVVMSGDRSRSRLAMFAVFPSERFFVELFLAPLHPGSDEWTLALGLVPSRDGLRPERFPQEFWSALSLDELWQELLQSAACDRNESEPLAELRWGPSPSDLDLHLLTLDAARPYDVVSYRRQGSLTDSPWVRLKSDIGGGHGPEILNAAPRARGKFFLAVSVFSNETLEAGTAVVKVATRNGPREFTNPRRRAGEWWVVCAVDLDSRTAEVVAPDAPVLQRLPLGYGVNGPGPNERSR